MGYKAKTGVLTLAPRSGLAHVAGQLFYDADSDCPTFHNSIADVAQQLGQEHWLRVKNVSGSTIGNAVPVYISGTNSGLPTIAPAKADTESTGTSIGLTTHSIANDTIGYVTTLGIVHGMDTSSFTPGAALFVHTANAGTLTNVVPTFPNVKSRIGIVIVQHATLGEVLVQPVNTTPRMLTVRNSANFPKTDTTLANITGLSIPVRAATTYAFEAMLDVDTSAVGGHKYAVSGTATVSAMRGNILATNALTTVINSRITALNSAVGAAGGTTQTVRIFFALTTIDAGTITLQFAQNANNGTSTVLANSTFQCQDVLN